MKAFTIHSHHSVLKISPLYCLTHANDLKEQLFVENNPLVDFIMVPYVFFGCRVRIWRYSTNFEILTKDEMFTLFCIFGYNCKVYLVSMLDSSQHTALQKLASFPKNDFICFGSNFEQSVEVNMEIFLKATESM